MQLNHHVFLGMLFGSILGVFYAAELTKFLPLLVLLGVVYLLGLFLRSSK